ncbi:DUF692 family multinuclear iron-containing protein [Thalassospira sp. MCCC 1A01428]|uniref:MNIO family bufferin maturase n=1 Tax=Thalassospira sp. MCCC 1A01428 TaxID=1470575 RepID=UPI00111C7380|nr:DUF692 domain-containing protein [Thalassospira sp. MCCC 1A01428]
MTEAKDSIVTTGIAPDQDRISKNVIPAASLPAQAGVGFKADHIADVFENAEPVTWFEVHPENYMVSGGPRLQMLTQLRQNFPISLHGVGLSLGGGEPLDKNHLRSLRALVDRFEPAQVSEHIAWSGHDGKYLADLLPTPLTSAALAHLVDAIDEVQNAVGRRILIENPTSYLALPQNSMAETDFIIQAARQSGCGLLIDVNNIFISAHNLGFAANDYIDVLPADLIGEIHLAGHEQDADTRDDVLIDTHSRPVADPVWALYQRLITRVGAKPTLIEWDNDVPAWQVLAAEAAHANDILDQCRHWPENQSQRVAS